MVKICKMWPKMVIKTWKYPHYGTFWKTDVFNRVLCHLTSYLCISRDKRLVYFEPFRMFSFVKMWGCFKTFLKKFIIFIFWDYKHTNSKDWILYVSNLDFVCVFFCFVFLSRQFLKNVVPKFRIFAKVAKNTQKLTKSHCIF